MRWWAHETSTVSEDAKIGGDTKFWQYCNIMAGTEIGEHCSLGQNVFVEGGVKLGNGVKVKNNVALYDGVICEDNVFLGPNCVFTNVLYPRSFVSRKNEFKKTYIHEGASICANATIICGNSIGKFAMVGAGAVVTQDVNDYELVVGNPAKKIGYVCECGERIFENENYTCERCKRKYEMKEDKLVEV